MDDYIDILLIEGIKNNLFLHDSSGKPIPTTNINISVSHSGAYTIICSSSRNLVCGIDIQEIDESLKLNWFNQEKILIENFIETPIENTEKKLLIMTSFKESLGKFLGLGLLPKKEVFEISSIKLKKYLHDFFYLVSFLNFPTLAGLGFLKNNYIVTLVTSETDLPKVFNCLEELKNEI